MSELPDGEYSIFIIDAEIHDDDELRVELTITSGEFKGEVLAVRASHLRADPLELMGMPGTLFVRDGAPHVAIDV